MVVWATTRQEFTGEIDQKNNQIDVKLKNFVFFNTVRTKSNVSKTEILLDSPSREPMKTRFQ